MRVRAWVLSAALGWMVTAPPARGEGVCEFQTQPSTTALVSPSARSPRLLSPRLVSPSLVSPAAIANLLAEPTENPEPSSKTGRGDAGEREALTGERARILLQSVTVPGWGHATMGRKTPAAIFAVLETAIWGSFLAFEVQQHLRVQSYELQAEIFAGIDLDDRDEDYRRLVGLYPSSEDYNRLVVRRDAANLYYDEPEAYRAYIEANEIRGTNAWNWASEESYLRYQELRRQAQKAGLRANSALGFAIANRLVSAILAVRDARHHSPKSGLGLQIGTAPGDFRSLRLGVCARF